MARAWTGNIEEATIPNETSLTCHITAECIEKPLPTFTDKLVLDVITETKSDLQFVRRHEYIPFHAHPVGMNDLISKIPASFLGIKIRFDKDLCGICCEFDWASAWWRCHDEFSAMAMMPNGTGIISDFRVGLTGFCPFMSILSMFVYLDESYLNSTKKSRFLSESRIPFPLQNRRYLLAV